MSETPMVDAAAKAGSDLGQANEAWSGIWPLARQLERENAALREQLASLKAPAGDYEIDRITEKLSGLARGSIIESPKFLHDVSAHLVSQYQRAERAEAQLAERDAEIAALKRTP